MAAAALSPAREHTLSSLQAIPPLKVQLDAVPCLADLAHCRCHILPHVHKITAPPCAHCWRLCHSIAASCGRCYHCVNNSAELFQTHHSLVPSTFVTCAGPMPAHCGSQLRGSALPVSPARRAGQPPYQPAQLGAALGDCRSGETSCRRTLCIQ